MSVKKKDLNRKVHWFLLSFSVPAPGQWVPASFMGSFTSKNLTLPAIAAMREANGMHEGAVLLCVSYRGYMSQHEMCGTSDAPVVTKLSEEYRQGLTAAALHRDRVTDNVQNPYEPMAANSAEMRHKANEWAEGFAEGTTVDQAARSFMMTPVSPPEPDPL